MEISEAILIAGATNGILYAFSAGLVWQQLQGLRRDMNGNKKALEEHLRHAAKMESEGFQRLTVVETKLDAGHQH